MDRRPVRVRKLEPERKYGGNRSLSGKAQDHLVHLCAGDRTQRPVRSDTSTRCNTCERKSNIIAPENHLTAFENTNWGSPASAARIRSPTSRYQPCSHIFCTAGIKCCRGSDPQRAPARLSRPCRPPARSPSVWSIRELRRLGTSGARARVGGGPTRAACLPFPVCSRARSNAARARGGVGGGEACVRASARTICTRNRRNEG
ncbi:hypothetical protein BC628DRAFT_1200327 [Trametes gibbosa]|nr:hypothetical protein BC628DRAFT_1200327 [Trametes gibbosa]